MVGADRCEPPTQEHGGLARPARSGLSTQGELTRPSPPFSGGVRREAELCSGPPTPAGPSGLLPSALRPLTRIGRHRSPSSARSPLPSLSRWKLLLIIS